MLCCGVQLRVRRYPSQGANELIKKLTDHIYHIVQQPTYAIQRHPLQPLRLISDFSPAPCLSE